VLTTEQQTDLYAATMEAAAAAKEDALFSNVTATSVNKPAGFTSNTNNAKVSKLNGAIGTAGNKRVGPSIVLKVMAWDTISLSVLAWYSGTVQPPATGVSAIATDLLPLLTSGITAGGGTKGGAIPTGTSGPLLSSALTSFLTNNQPYTPSNPKAFLNWMVVDEEFAGVSSLNHMNALQVPTFNAGDTNKQMVGLNRLVIRRNGWIYVYLSNESSQDVFFDNLVVNLTHGPLVEQKDYYPFGLEIPGLSTKALKPNYVENRYKFNGIEYDTAFGLDYYEARFGDYDPQIGRFTQIDPKVENAEGWSVYSAILNNPIKNVDPLGDSTIPGGGFWRNAVERFKDGAKSTYNLVKSLGTSEGWQNIVLNASANAMPGAAANKADAVIDGVKSIPNMNKDQIGHAIGFGGEKLVEAVALTKGAGLDSDALAGAEVGSEMNAASTISPNVQKVFNTLNDTKAEGGTVKLNPLNTSQELNMTFKDGASKLDFRIETHKPPTKYGGDRTTPIRHMNVDLTPQNNLLNNGHKILD